MTKANRDATSAPNRRQVLGFAGAGATLMALHDSVAASTPPDALTLLHSRWLAAKEAGNRATLKLAAIRDELGDDVFGDPNPDQAVRKRLGLPAYVGGPISLLSITRFNENTEMLVRGSDCYGTQADYRRRCAEGRARLEWWHEASRQQELAREVSGYNAAFGADGDAWSKVARIERAILETPATCLAGVLVKLEITADFQANKFADYLPKSELEWDEMGLLSAINDARAILGGTASRG